MLRMWMRRASLLLVPLTLAASTYLATTPATVNSAPAPVITPAVHTASIIPPVRTPTIRMPDMQRVAVQALPLGVKRVVLDAGHGGTDPGAVSLGVTEKDVTLDIGKRLTLLLEAGGFDVITTRDQDATLPLRERARLANESRSDVFVSIHVNTIEKHVSSRGVETYYLGATNDPKLTQLAAAENYESGYTMRDLRHLLDGIYADARRDESRELAAVVQRHLYDRLKGSDEGLENWGVKRAPFIVLVATEMPAVLAEVGCISNTKEAAMLGRAEYRQKIAEALYDGIRAYASASDAPQKKGT
jgi:N-acetylmuramoyl-L-alanine amidase